MSATTAPGVLPGTINVRTAIAHKVGDVVLHRSADGTRAAWYVVVDVQVTDLASNEYNVELLRERGWEQRRAGGAA